MAEIGAYIVDVASSLLAPAAEAGATTAGITGAAESIAAGAGAAGAGAGLGTVGLTGATAAGAGAGIGAGLGTAAGIGTAAAAANKGGGGTFLKDFAKGAAGAVPGLLGQPKIPTPSQPAEAPAPDQAALKAQRRRATALQRKQGGRLSTILSGSDKLG